jgi:Small integral membrane protein
MKFDSKKLKNYKFWVSISAIVLLVLQMNGVVIIPSQFDLIVNSILSVLVALGIIDGPKKGEDDDYEENNDDNDIMEE